MKVERIFYNLIVKLKLINWISCRYCRQECSETDTELYEFIQIKKSEILNKWKKSFLRKINCGLPTTVEWWKRSVFHSICLAESARAKNKLNNSKLCKNREIDCLQNNWTVQDQVYFIYLILFPRVPNFNLFRSLVCCFQIIAIFVFAIVYNTKFNFFTMSDNF